MIFVTDRGMVPELKSVGVGTASRHLVGFYLRAVAGLHAAVNSCEMPAAQAAAGLAWRSQVSALGVVPRVAELAAVPSYQRRRARVSRKKPP